MHWQITTTLHFIDDSRSADFDGDGESAVLTHGEPIAQLTCHRNEYSLPTYVTELLREASL